MEAHRADNEYLLSISRIMYCWAGYRTKSYHLTVAKRPPFSKPSLGLVQQYAENRSYIRQLEHSLQLLR